jgi:metal-responsive CopG/Arc/MetJ family transcriptional regulator
MNAVRLNMTLPKDLADKLNSMVKPRQKSYFIAEALRDKIETIQKEKMNKSLEEGYKKRKQESLLIAKEFETADLEGWNDY